MVARSTKTAAGGSPGLSRAGIVAVALALIDREELENFSLRNLAKALGVNTTAIYWHLAGRNVVLAEVMATVIAGIAPPVQVDWRAWLRQLMHNVRDALKRHPNTAPLLGAQLVSNIAASLDLVEGTLAALTLSIGLMTLGTFIIAIAPTYAAIGVAAPSILILARLLQGFSVGGQFGSATAFLAEQNPARRGFYSSWQAASQGLTTLLASGFGVALSTLLDPIQLAAWGWRIPFVFGLLVGPVALYIRTTLREGNEYRTARAATSPLQTALARQKLRMLIGTGLIIMVTVSAYTMLLMPTFAIRQLGIPASAGLTATLIFGALQFELCPIFGQLSDRIGRVPVMGTRRRAESAGPGWRPQGGSALT